MFVDLGLGRALATRFLLKPNTTVIAAVRHPKHPTSQSLSELPRGEGSKLITVKIDSVSDTDAQDAVKLIQTEHGIDKLDVVAANAGHGTVYGDLSQVKPHEVRDLVDINTIGRRIGLFAWNCHRKQADVDFEALYVYFKLSGRFLKQATGLASC